MFSDDTVRELFMMASSENSAPQRFLILWKLRRYPQNTVSLSFFLSEPPQKKKICYPPKMLPCCSFSLKQFYHIYIYISKTSRKLFDVHSGYSDCRTNLLLIYVDLLRKFGWHPYTIRWYFFPQARYMAYRIPPKNHFTRKTQITHVTHKKRTSRNLPNLFAGSLHSW